MGTEGAGVGAHRGPSLPLLIHRFLSCRQMRNGNLLTADIRAYADAGGREDAEGSKSEVSGKLKV